MRRCFYNDDLMVGLLELTKEESRHLCSVLRAKEGSKLVILNGVGAVADATLVCVDSKFATVEIEKVAQFVRPKKSLTLLQATLANNNNDYIVREMTAIGAAAIVFFETNNSECKLRNKIENKLERWNAIAIEACKQSGNPFLPKIQYFSNIRNINFNQFDTKILAGLGENFQILKSVTLGSSTCLAIGPEGDFSPSEYEFLKSNGFIECRLAQHVLRSETAAVYAFSVLDQMRYA